MLSSGNDAAISDQSIEVYLCLFVDASCQPQRRTDSVTCMIWMRVTCILHSTVHGVMFELNFFIKMSRHPSMCNMTDCRSSSLSSLYESFVSVKYIYTDILCLTYTHRVVSCLFALRFIFSCLCNLHAGFPMEIM